MPSASSLLQFERLPSRPERFRNRRARWGCWLAAGLLWGPLPLRATDSSLRDGTAEVAAVRFGTVRGPGGDWYEAEIEVRVQPGSENATRHVDRVQVALNLGCEVPRGATRAWEFYQSTATAVTVAQGRAWFRFYLPPEIVQRDRLSGEPRVYVIEVAVAGRALPLQRAQVAPVLTSADALEQFRRRVATLAPANAGILRAQAFTPFATAADGPPAPTLLHPP